MNYLLTHWLISLAGTLFLGLSAMVLHEFGHLVTSLMVGIKVKSIGLCMKGMYIVREAGSPSEEYADLACGPADKCCADPLVLECLAYLRAGESLPRHLQPRAGQRLRR